MATPIESTKNPLIRRFRQAARGEDATLMVAEGQRLVDAALEAGLRVVEAVYGPKLLGRPGGEEQVAKLREVSGSIRECSDKVIQRLSHLDTHQGVSVILRRPVWEFTDLLGAGPALLVVAAGIQDPGNLGALVRAAEAAGASGLLVLAGSADPYRDKALRGSAGSVFRLPCLSGVDTKLALQQIRGHGLQLLVAESSSDSTCWDTDLKLPTALVLGAEGAGVSARIASAADALVSVPIVPAVESLNVSVAAGVLLFEARRQRR